MLFIFGLLLLLIPTHTCVEMFCRFNQTDPCYASLGHKLYLQMVTDARDQRLELYKIIGYTKHGVLSVNNTHYQGYHYESNRFEFIFKNGTLIINSVIRSDSGTYRLELYDSTGTETYTNNLQVNVEVSLPPAPIGSVEVSINCSSSGEKRVSCSSEGDQLIFSWTLNGQELEDGNNTIHLDEETSGSITCTAKNSVSHGQYTTRVNRCAVERSVSVVFVVVWSLEMMLLLTLLGGFHIYIKYCRTHTSGRKQEEEIAL
ncbi:T-cell surface antigen CD2-like isoform X4 [Xyrauchen texanus]|uniref:T-cell surface antigen CD2-like isoform X1 n=1 Tax=Xyrauchen texanus TaxID=154827 RepID=UPI002241925A|nr:T-cell surface antigen CD2-like isoform X1 [Xyrauchen texanus]XP_052005468.1 T-cell surface antigen CD2-like isoform X2 [Xyrauchen texanus]XP_052005469.1 T-cell surface antigen CD2-like isoform X3 [Xyrauchen texanus]XP_052005470.1 T-cell surface antigen CD2-like isoform X4 [Xyrauchen texanus]